MNERTAAALLRDLAGLGTVSEERFDRITRTAAAPLATKAAFRWACSTRTAVDRGLRRYRDPRPGAQGHVLPARQRRFSSHEIATERGYRFYAGQPLIIRGHAVCTLRLLATGCARWTTPSARGCRTWRPGPTRRSPRCSATPWRTWSARTSRPATSRSRAV